MRFGSFGLAGSVLLFLVAGGCSSKPAPDAERVGTARGAIQGGTTDTTHTFAVGVHGQAGGGVGLCSGSLITPNLVMTARHCVDQTPPEINCDANPSFLGTMFSASELYVTTGSSNVNVTGSSTWHTVAKVTVPTDSHICGNDIALLTLDDVIASTEAKPIIPGVQYPMDAIIEGYSFDYTAIGFGATDGSGQTGQGTRRIRSNITLTCIPNSDTTFDCPTMDAMGNPVNINPREYLGGDGTCEGDSGSGAYDQKLFDKGIFLSHGILSRGAADPTNCVGSLYTRVDAWRDLIVNTANTASVNWTLYPKPNPDWTVYVPPPSKADAGTPDSGSKPTTKPSGKGLGEACGADGDCASKLCKDPGDGNTVCSEDCSSASCPDGYTCTSDTQLCFASSDPQSGGGSTTTTTSGGCSVGRDPTKPIPWRGVGLGAALALAAVVRRRKRS